MRPHVESPDDQLVEPDDETSISTSSEPQVGHPIDLAVDAMVDWNDDLDFSKDQTAENDQNEDHEAQGEKV